MRAFLNRLLKPFGYAIVKFKTIKSPPPFVIEE